MPRRIRHLCGKDERGRAAPHPASAPLAPSADTLPFHPQKQTSQKREAMSANGRKRTYALQQKGLLFDHFVGTAKQ